MAFVATKLRAENKSYKIKYKALKEFEKGTPHKKGCCFPFQSAKKYLINMAKELRQNL